MPVAPWAVAARLVSLDEESESSPLEQAAEHQREGERNEGDATQGHRSHFRLLEGSNSSQRGAGGRGDAGQRSKLELTELEMPPPFDHTLMSTAGGPEHVAEGQPLRTVASGRPRPSPVARRGRRSRGLRATAARRAPPRRSPRPTARSDDELDEPPVLTTFDWLTTTRAVLMDTASGTRTSGSSGAGRGTGSGAGDGSLGVRRDRRGRWSRPARTVPRRTRRRRRRCGRRRRLGEHRRRSRPGRRRLHRLEGASSVVVAGAATAPPSRSSCVVSGPHPATTTVNTMRPDRPQPRGGPPASHDAPSRWLAAAARGRPPARGTDPLRGATTRSSGCRRTRRRSPAASRRWTPPSSSAPIDRGTHAGRNGDRTRRRRDLRNRDLLHPHGRARDDRAHPGIDDPADRPAGAQIPGSTLCTWQTRVRSTLPATASPVSIVGRTRPRRPRRSTGREDCRPRSSRRSRCPARSGRRPTAARRRRIWFAVGRCPASSVSSSLSCSVGVTSVSAFAVRRREREREHPDDLAHPHALVCGSAESSPAEEVRRRGARRASR